MLSNTLYFAKYLLHQYRNRFFVLLIVLTGDIGASLLLPYVVGQSAPQLFGNTSLLDQHLVFSIATWIGLLAVQALVKFQSAYLLNSLGARLMADLSCRLYDHIQILPMTYFKDVRKGDLLSLLTNDLAVVSYYVTSVLVTLLPNVLIACGCVVMMYLIDSTIAFLILVLLPLVYLITRIVGRNIHPISQEILEKQADSMAMASENIGTISLIKAFNREEKESSRYRQRIEEILSLRKRQFFYQALLSPLTYFCSAVGIVVVIAVSAVRLQEGVISDAEWVTLLLYGFILTRPMSAFSGLYGQTRYMLVAFQRLLDLYSKEREPSNDNATPIQVLRGDVSFEKVSFSYFPHQRLLENISFTLEAGKCMLILGENGAGKSTMLHLLMRFYEPKSGVICIDGFNLSSATTRSVRQAIGHVPQDVVLCNGTIMDNIVYGVVSAGHHAIDEACRLAGLDDILETLPKGIQTNVGEGGVKLSGGQKQRIVLARALLRKPKILLFDEPTSMLDELGRQRFKQHIELLARRFTVIMISHDPTLAIVADEVYCLKNGALGRA